MPNAKIALDTAKSDKRPRRVTGVLIAALFAMTQAVLAEEESPTVAWGKDLFMTHCVSCHGTNGKGDGPAGTALKIPPADLTQISSRRGNSFPRAKIAKIIDGESRTIAAHGSRQMPVWGKLFRRDKPDAEARMQVFALSAYLESIQSKPAP